MSLLPTQRFSSRVDAYVRYRPGYPVQVMDALQAQGALPEGAFVADVGSGTGILSTMFLERGHPVFGVEPNAEMRAAAECSLFPAYVGRFTSVPAVAEATTLPAASVDLIAAGQAFHWFNPVRCRVEFARILRPGGRVALIWNERMVDATQFLAAYEQLLHTFSTDYASVSVLYLTPERVGSFFGNDCVWFAKFPNRQSFDFDELRGRLLSSSYAPESGSSNHEPMLVGLRAIFDQHQVDGRVEFLYETNLYLGLLEG